MIDQLIAARKCRSSVTTSSSWRLLFRCPGFSQVPRNRPCSPSWNSRAISWLCMRQWCTLILGFSLRDLMSSTLFIKHVHVLLFLICRDFEYLFACGSVVSDLLIWLDTSDERLLGLALSCGLAWHLFVVVCFTHKLACVLHQRTHRLVVVIELVIESRSVSLLWSPVMAWPGELLLHFLVEVFSSFLELRPVVAGLLKVLHSIL